MLVVDSWGKPESGLLEGNFVWEGRYYECINAQDDKEITGQYCNITISFSTGTVICVLLPHFCSLKIFTNY